MEATLIAAIHRLIIKAVPPPLTTWISGAAKIDPNNGAINTLKIHPTQRTFS
jgi:hypothetical protein